MYTRRTSSIPGWSTSLITETCRGSRALPLSCWSCMPSDTRTCVILYDRSVDRDATMPACNRLEAQEDGWFQHLVDESNIHRKQLFVAKRNKLHLFGIALSNPPVFESSPGTQGFSVRFKPCASNSEEWLVLSGLIYVDDQLEFNLGALLLLLVFLHLLPVSADLVTRTVQLQGVLDLCPIPSNCLLRCKALVGLDRDTSPVVKMPVEM